MSRIGIIGDLHLGINESKPLFNEYHMSCINHIYDEFKKEGITDIVYLGDVFDKRYSISVKTLKQANDIFDNEFNQTFLLGNHDICYKNSNELNSVEILLGDKNKVIVNTPEEIEFGDKKILIVPWINKTNIEESTNIINDSEAEYMLGHLEMSGFEMIRGIICRDSQFKLSILNKFKHVISGHFHCFSQQNNITYLGSVCEMTWNDYNVDKYAGILDSETDELQLLSIPRRLHEIIRIKKDTVLPDIENYKDKIVKVYLYTKRTITLEKFITKLDDLSLSVIVIEEEILNATEDFDIENHNMSILDLWQAYLGEMSMTKKDATIVNKIFNDVYLKVQTGDLD